MPGPFVSFRDFMGLQGDAGDTMMSAAIGREGLGDLDQSVGSLGALASAGDVSGVQKGAEALRAKTISYGEYLKSLHDPSSRAALVEKVYGKSGAGATALNSMVAGAGRMAMGGAEAQLAADKARIEDGIGRASTLADVQKKGAEASAADDAARVKRQAEWAGQTRRKQYEEDEQRRIDAWGQANLKGYDPSERFREDKTAYDIGKATFGVGGREYDYNGISMRQLAEQRMRATEGHKGARWQAGAGGGGGYVRLRSNDVRDLYDPNYSPAHSWKPTPTKRGNVLDLYDPNR
jgi:hypothetical protein